MALVVTVLSKNKMAGMTWYKLFNLLVVIPLVAFFTPSTYTQFFRNYSDTLDFSRYQRHDIWKTAFLASCHRICFDYVVISFLNSTIFKKPFCLKIMENENGIWGWDIVKLVVFGSIIFFGNLLLNYGFEEQGIRGKLFGGQPG